MKIVQTDQVRTSGSPHVRGGKGHSSQIMFDSDVLGRDPNRPDNFFMQVSFVGEGEFSSPRHRHNFEQFRYMIEGEADYPEGVMRGGTLGYFPEGVYYGPQERLVGTVVIVQFGGPSGSGYVDRKQMKAAFEGVKALGEGEFVDGTYHRRPGVAGPPVQDGNEAIIEFARGRPLVYPRAQYATPILIDSEAFPWTPVRGAAGLSEKALGTFSSAQIRAARYRLEPGARLAAYGRGAYLVLSGGGELAGEPFRTMTALYLEKGEEAAFTAAEISDVLRIGLPTMDMIAAEPPAAERSAAA